jgi:hypothetical protein
MSRIVGDALMAGPAPEFAPEYVNVRLTRGQMEALIGSAEHVRDILKDVDDSLGESGADNVDFLAKAIDAARAQIGGAK